MMTMVPHLGWCPGEKKRAKKMNLVEKLRRQTEEAQAQIKKEKEEREAAARKEELLSAKNAALTAMSNAAAEGRFSC
jgi:hypothetical protein